ncbi:hypothetical protein DIZ76_016115 [Coccidioides immitis]|nr:hypothetical protein DIZ76_016115 [Coccidioides immitis]
MGSISQQALSVHACTAPATLFILYDIKQCSFSAGQLTAGESSGLPDLEVRACGVAGAGGRAREIRRPTSTPVT